MKVSIIIVNYRVPKLLRACLQSIRDQVKAECEVIVTDNASGDGSVEMVREEFPWVHLIANPSNDGFAAGNNLALPHATGEYVFYLNPDAEVIADAVDVLVKYLDTHPDVGLVAPRLINTDGSLQKSVHRYYSFWDTLIDNRLFPYLFKNSKRLKSYNYAFWPHDEEREIDWAKGAALMVRRAILSELGAFDEQFWIYGEEIDLCYRIQKASWKIVFYPHAVIRHHEKQSSRQHSTVMFIQNYKSLYLFIRKHYSKLDFELYRARAVFSILVWLASFWMKKIAGKDGAEAEFSKYVALFKWHFKLKENLHKPLLINQSAKS